MLPKDKFWHSHKEQLKQANDLENLFKMEIVDTYKDKIPEYVNILLEQSNNSFTSDNVKYIFSTVHRFKGLECDVVRLLDDFAIPDDGQLGGSSTRRLQVQDRVALKEEYNLLYVGLTRAKHQLIINNAVYFLLNKAGYNFENIVPAPTVHKGNCVRCGGAVVNEYVAGVVQDRVQVTRLKFRKGGPLCKDCFMCSKRPMNHTLSGILKAVQVGPSDSLPYPFNEMLPEAQGVRTHAVQKGRVPSHFNIFFSSILGDKVIKPNYSDTRNQSETKEVEILNTEQWRAEDVRAAEESRLQKVNEERVELEAAATALELQEFMEDEDQDMREFLEDDGFSPITEDDINEIDKLEKDEVKIKVGMRIREIFNVSRLI